MARRTSKAAPPTDDQIRHIMLYYFHNRNKNATSMMGRRSGAAAPISVLRADLKASHGLTASQVICNLTYLISQGWVEEKPVEKSFTTERGGTVPSVTKYYVITAAGIDKIQGPGEFTRDRFHGIRIEASGQNIITLGDGNQVNAYFRDVGEALSELREVIKSTSAIDEATKIDLVADIDSIQDQLAKPQPNRAVVRALWDGIEKAAMAAGLAASLSTVAALVSRLF